MLRPSVNVFYCEADTLYFAAQKFLKNCRIIMENPANSVAITSIVCFQNSCPGTRAKEALASEEHKENCQGDATQTSLRSIVDAVGGERNDGKSKSVMGGITCCVQECFSNSIRESQFPFM